MTIKELLHQAVEALQNSGNEFLNSEVLLAYALGEDREYLISHSLEEVVPDLERLFLEYVRRAKAGEPVSYITGEKEFYGLNFFVDERVLIPRPETEHLVERVLVYLRNKSDVQKSFRILDVGTGSGNIAVSVVKSFKNDDAEIDEVFAVDCDVDALNVARINAESHGVDDRVRVFQSNLLEFAEVGEKFDVIVANLPYIGMERNRFVSAETEKFEPNVALFGGEGGLELYKKMFQELVDKEVKFEVLLGEFGFAQRDELEKLLSKYFDQKWVIDKDYAGIDRIFIVKK